MHTLEYALQSSIALFLNFAHRFGIVRNCHRGALALCRVASGHEWRWTNRTRLGKHERVKVAGLNRLLRQWKSGQRCGSGYIKNW